MGLSYLGEIKAVDTDKHKTHFETALQPVWLWEFVLVEANRSKELWGKSHVLEHLC